MKSYSREFILLFDFIDEYYSRDTGVSKVERILIQEQIANSTNNEKHAARFLGILDEAWATDTSDKNVTDIVLDMRKRELAEELAVAITNNKPHEELLATYTDTLKATTLDEAVDQGLDVYDSDEDMDDLLASAKERPGLLKLYPAALNDRLDGGLGPSDHVTLYALPEMGKTASILTMAVGFARQGARGIVFNNEESIDRLRLRALSCCTGMSLGEIRNNPEAAKDIARENGYHNIIFVSMSPGSLQQIDRLVEKYEAKWFIVDQLRNLSMKAENRTNQLEAAAQGIRTIAKRHGAIAISVTQAADSATGKSVLEMGDVDSSNVGIPGACDVLLGIGANDEQKDHDIRVMSLSKNKIGGDHSSFPVKLERMISRYSTIK